MKYNFSEPDFDEKPVKKSTSVREETVSEEKSVALRKDEVDSSLTKSVSKSIDDGVTEDEEDIDVCLVKYPGDIPIIDTVVPPPGKDAVSTKDKADITDRSESKLQKDAHMSLKKRTKYDDTGKLCVLAYRRFCTVDIN